MMLGHGIDARADWVPLAPDVTQRALAVPEYRPLLSADQQAPGRTVLEFELPGFETRPVIIDGRAYARIVLPGHVQRYDRGQPALPYVTATLAIPDAGTPAVRLTDIRTTEIPTAPIVPGKGSIPRSVDPATVPYTFGEIYTGGGVFPADWIESVSPFIVRDVRGVNVRINPLRYDADRGVLVVLQRATIVVETAGAGGVNVKQRPSPLADGGWLDRTSGRQIDRQFGRLYGELFLNVESTAGSIPSNEFDGSARYNPVPGGGAGASLLVITDDAFVAALDTFVNWKRQRGLQVELVTTGEIGGTLPDIQDTITERYFSDLGLTFVVLVGDLEQIPAYAGEYEGADDDTRYVMLEGDDLYPDAFISRISAQNSTQVETQVAKFVRYEKEPDLGGTWYQRAAGIASSGGTPPDHERADLLRVDLLDYNFTDVDQIYQIDGDSSAEITAAVNAGRSLINYLGHGVTYAWTNPYFSYTHVNELTNGWAQPWIIDVSCKNGDFSRAECFAETWLRAGTPLQPHGAVAMYSAATTTPWVPPTVMQAEVVRLLTTETENTIGALCFSGIMEVLDQYPGDSGLQLVEQYNIFGDCSLVVRTATPTALSISHDPYVELYAPSFSVDAGVPGATCAVCSDGIVHGVGVTDATGQVDIQLDNPVMTPGDVTLTVTGYNLAPQISTVEALVPAAISVTPDTIPVGVPTDVTVTVSELVLAGIADVAIYIEGYGVSGLQDITDGTGSATISVTPAYGETLTVRGVADGTSHDLFVEPLVVDGAAALTGATIDAQVVSIGMTGSLTPFIEGTVTGSATETGLTLLLSGAGIDTTETVPGSVVTVAVTPVQLGTVNAVLAKTGYDIFTTPIDVVAAYCSLSGGVADNDGGAPLETVRVFGFAAGDDPGGVPVFDVVTDLSGAYLLTDDVPVGSYDIYAEKFGYVGHQETVFLLFGANTLPIGLDASSSGAFTGTVTDTSGTIPLAASVKVYRADTLELIEEVESSEIDGSYATGALPAFDYQIVTMAKRYVRQTVSVTMVEGATPLDFALVPTNGDILLLDDNVARGASRLRGDKLDKNGRVIARGYETRSGRSVDELVTELEYYGFTVTVEDIDETNLTTWPEYDLLLVSCGDNTNTIYSSSMRIALRNHLVHYDGKLLIEGGELAFNHASAHPDFAWEVLHTASHEAENGGNLTVDDATHYLMSTPNQVVGPLGFDYVGYGDGDVVTPRADAQLVGGWTDYPGNASIVCYDPNPSPIGGQVVFFSFNYAAAYAAGRAPLLQNAVLWLITPEVGTGSISGTVDLAETEDDSGAVVTLTPGDIEFVTAADGAYTFPTLFAGSYQITVSKDGWAGAVADIDLTEGEVLTDVDFYLNRVVTVEYCESPELVIPDNDPVGLTVEIPVSLDRTVSSVAVYVNISHPFPADLEVTLVSPQGTEILLHNNFNIRINFWYPDERTPFESLDILVGEPTDGNWQLRCTDQGQYDVGTLHDWCLRLEYENDLTPVDLSPDLPQVLSLDGNYPNPFNPSTQIHFSLPQRDLVELAVYDLQGRRVATLKKEEMPAGRHAVAWDGRDQRGQGVASGMYFYRLATGGELLVGKMMLLK